MIIQCSECIYWLPEENNNFGQCRRNAPIPEVSKSGGGPFIGPANYRAIWKYTRNTDGCGEGERGKATIIEEMRDQTQVYQVKPPQTKQIPRSFDEMVRKANEK